MTRIVRESAIHSKQDQAAYKSILAWKVLLGAALVIGAVSSCSPTEEHQAPQPAQTSNPVLTTSTRPAPKPKAPALSYTVLKDRSDIMSGYQDHVRLDVAVQGSSVTKDNLYALWQSIFEEQKERLQGDAPLWTVWVWMYKDERAYKRKDLFLAMAGKGNQLDEMFTCTLPDNTPITAQDRKRVREINAWVQAGKPHHKKRRRLK